jgi:response regulator of citrate/malate metabolism
MSNIKREQGIQELEDELKKLRKTVRVLTETVNDLKTKIDDVGSTTDERRYSMFDQNKMAEGDVSWDRLVSIIEEKDAGRTAKELAKEWGKSRSRTSEVLNHLVNEGRLVKYRDGRRIRFRTVDE